MATRTDVDSAGRLAALRTYRTGATSMYPSGGDATEFNRTDPNLDHSTGKTYADSTSEGYIRRGKGVGPANNE
jgi:hypothetical protein